MEGFTTQLHTLTELVENANLSRELIDGKVVEFRSIQLRWESPTDIPSPQVARKELFIKFCHGVAQENPYAPKVVVVYDGTQRDGCMLASFSTLTMGDVLHIDINDGGEYHLVDMEAFRRIHGTKAVKIERG